MTKTSLQMAFVFIFPKCKQWQVMICVTFCAQRPINKQQQQATMMMMPIGIPYRLIVSMCSCLVFQITLYPSE